MTSRQQPGSPRHKRSSTRIPSARSSSAQLSSSQASTIPRTPSPLTTSDEKSSSQTSLVGNPWSGLGMGASAWSHQTWAVPQSFGTLGSTNRLSQVTLARAPSIGLLSSTDIASKTEKTLPKHITKQHANLSGIPFPDSPSGQNSSNQRPPEGSVGSSEVASGMPNRTRGRTEGETRLMINFLDRDVQLKNSWRAARPEQQSREPTKHRKDKKKYPTFTGPENFFLEMSKIVDEVQTYILTASYCKLDREQKFAYEHLWTTAQKMKELRILYNRCYVTKQPGLYNQISHVLEYCQRATRDPKRNVAVLAGFAREIYTLTQQLHAEIEPLRKRYKEDAAFRKVTNRDDLARRSSSGMNVLQTARSTMRPQDPPTVPGSDDTAE